MTLSFPINKSFYRTDNLFKHDFLLRESFDTVDLLWYRTHEPFEGFGDQKLHGLDDIDFIKISRVIEQCPDNELESKFDELIVQLNEIQAENEIFDFYYEFYYMNSEDIIKDEMLLQRRNDILRELRIIESDELSSDYLYYWDYVYEKSSLKAMISPFILDNSNLVTGKKAGKTNKNKAPSDSSDITVSKQREVVKQIRYDESSSLMNARFLLQQLKDKGLEEDKLTFINIFADDEDEDNMDEEYSNQSSGTLSAEVDSIEASGSKLTEISFEKETTVESDKGMKDPFKDRSFDCLYYVARQIYEHLLSSSNMYFNEAPTILLENDLVIEMKELELKYLEHYNKLANHYIVKIVDKDGLEGFNSRFFRQGVLRITDESVRKMENIKQEGTRMTKKTKNYNQVCFAILRAPKVELSDYRKLINFDIRSEETKRLEQKRKIKQYKTMVCLAGRTKLRKYDVSEKITSELNALKYPMQRIANLTSVAREHATSTVSGYLDTLLRLIMKRKFFEDYPDNMFSLMNTSKNKTKEMLKALSALKTECGEAKTFLSAKSMYKPLGVVRRTGDNTGNLDIEALKKIIANQNESYQGSYGAKEIDTQIPCFTSGLNLILEQKDDKDVKTFSKTAISSKLQKHQFEQRSEYNFESNGFPKEYSQILKNESD